MTKIGMKYSEHTTRYEAVICMYHAHNYLLAERIAHVEERVKYDQFLEE